MNFLFHPIHQLLFLSYNIRLLMKQTLLLVLGILLASSVLFTSCNSAMTDAKSAYDSAMTKVDSLSGVVETVTAALGATKGNFDGLLAQAKSMETPDSSIMATLQNVGSKLFAQTSVVSGIEETLGGFKDFDLAGMKPEGIMEKVSSMQSSFGDIGTKIATANETISSVDGMLGGLKEKIAGMLTEGNQE